MTVASDAPPAPASAPFPTVAALGVVQLLMWGSTFYLLAVLAPAIHADTGWSYRWVIGGVTIALLTAGLISPYVGRAIDRRGGRPVLVFGSAATVAAFVALALAPNLPVYLFALGADGHRHGDGALRCRVRGARAALRTGARSAITNLTLFGGFGSTVCWPLSAWLVEAWGWRTACLVYAAIHLVLAVPIHALVFPRDAAATGGSHRFASCVRGRALPRRR